MYEFREVTMKNGLYKRKTLAIDFENPKMAIVGEFLMTDATLLSGKVIVEIDLVLLGEKEVNVVSGNRCGLEIRSDKTIITDLFDDIEDTLQYESFTISTIELRELIVMWLEKLLEFQKENTGL